MTAHRKNIITLPFLIHLATVKVLSKVSSSYLQHYGEVPEYLQQRNEQERRAQEEYDEFVKEQREQGVMKHLSDEERRAVLEVLKHMAA